MRATRSRAKAITSLLAAVGAGFAVSALIGAPTAVADPNTIACQPGQVVIDGQCNMPDTKANVPAPPPQGGTGGYGTGGDSHGR
jgi:hypothetical protein